MTKDEALRMALEALEDLNGMAQFFPDELFSDHPDVMKAAQAITAIKEALQSNEQVDEAAPVAKNEGGRITWMIEDWPQNCLLYTHPPVPTAQPEQEKERCVGCEACIDTACGRDECPKGWPKAAQPEHDKDEALRMALEALEDLNGMAQFFPDELSSDHPDVMKAAQAITAIKEALSSPNGEAQPEQEPVARYKERCADGSRCLHGCLTGEPCYYTTPPQRTWVGLTDEDKQIAFDDTQEGGGFWEFADAIEAKLKEKNT